MTEKDQNKKPRSAAARTPKTASAPRKAAASPRKAVPAATPRSADPAATPVRKRRPYHSHAIAERRQRILAATMALVSQRGIDGFNLTELSRQAGVAQKTLYNSFGSKEALIASAFDYYLEEQETRFPAEDIHDLNDIFDQLLNRCQDFINNKQWARGSNFLFYSFTIDTNIYDTLKRMSLVYTQHFRRLYAGHAGLIDDAPVDYIDMQIANVAHGVVHDWLMGRISDAAFPHALCFGILSMFLTFVQGDLRAEVETLAARFAARLKEAPLPPPDVQPQEPAPANS